MWMEVRAAALYRFLHGLDQTVLLAELQDIDDVDAAAVLKHMITASEPEATFPTQDLVVLSRVLHWIACFCRNHSDMTIQLAVTISSYVVPSFVCPADTAKSNARVAELALLNKNLFELGGINQEETQIEWCQPSTPHLFHPESQFLRIYIV